MTDYGDFGSFNIGRLVLREALSVASETSSAQGRAMKLTGQEAVPLLTSAQLAAIQDDLPSMVGYFVPVYFTQKTDRNGYWLLTDVQSDLMNWNGELVTASWQLTLTRIGTDTEIDLESRLSGSLARDNAYGATGERYHCPPVGHYGYLTGDTQASVLIRQGSEGPMVVYRGVPADVNPRWGCPVSTYLLGRVRFLDSHDIERSGTTFSVRPVHDALEPSSTLTPSSTTLPESGYATHWTMDNTLVQVTPPASGAGLLDVGAYTGGAWHVKTWDVLIGGISVGVPDTVSVLRNEPEIVVIRLLVGLNPGRVTVDVTLRRGSRVAELYVQSPWSETIAVQLVSAEAGSVATAGLVVASADDANSNRYVIGSASAFTGNAVQGGISATSVTGLDAFVGVQAGGLAAQQGDLAADLFSAYLAAPAETIQAVLR